MRDANSQVSGFVGTVTPNSPHNLPYYPMRGYLLVWSLLDEKGKAVSGGKKPFADLAHAEQISATLPPEAAGHALHLVLTLLDSTNSVAAEQELAWPAS
jgi:hypothetical protein